MFQSNHLIGFGVDAGAVGTWQSSTANGSIGGSDTSGWASFTHVQFIPQASLSVTGGSQVRLTLKCPVANGATMTGLYIGQAAAGYSTTAPAFAATPTQILVSGSGTITMTAGGSDVLTDAASFVMPSSNGICIAWQHNASTANMRFSGSSLPTNWKTSYKSGADAATVAKSGYTDYTAAASQGGWMVSLVEEFA